MTKRRLPANNVTPLEAGRLAEKRQAKRLGMGLHPASGAGRTKADMSDGDNVVEYKTCNGKSHTVQYDQLYDTLRQAESRGSVAWYVVDFNGLRIEARITRS